MYGLTLAAETSASMGTGSGVGILVVAAILIFAGSSGGRGR